MTTSEHVTTTEDGLAVPMTLYEPDTSNGIVVQLNSSMQTPRRYYRHFAGHLAARGFTVLTYDYRHLITPDRNPATMPAGVADSGRYDQRAVTEWLKARYPKHVFQLVAHSMGGQIVGLSPHAGRFNSILMVATAQGYWRDWVGLRAKIGAFLQHGFWAPAVVRLFGYYRASLWGGLDMPAETARELRRFCLHEGWLVDENNQRLRPHNADFRGPVRHLILADDTLVVPGSDIDLADFYPSALHQREVVAPSRWGVNAIGHFGYFRKDMPKAVWDEAADWLKANGKSTAAAAADASSYAK